MARLVNLFEFVHKFLTALRELDVEADTVKPGLFYCLHPPIEEPSQPSNGERAFARSPAQRQELEALVELCCPREGMETFRHRQRVLFGQGDVQVVVEAILALRLRLSGGATREHGHGVVRRA